jgi:hypothetical protein
MSSKEIARFKILKHELSMLRTPTDIHWLRVDAQPVKVTKLSRIMIRKQLALLLCCFDADFPNGHKNYWYP